MTQTRATCALDAAQFDTLAAIVLDRSGLALSAGDRPQLQERLGHRLGELGLDSFAQYETLLTAGPFQREEFQSLLEMVTPASPGFFDCPGQLEAFERVVLPELLKARGDVRRLRLWAVGCGRGHEAYTLAMIVHRALGVRLGDWHVEVLGTDMLEGRLASASAGRYTKGDLAGLPEVMKLRYFSSAGGGWAANDEILSMVDFEHLDPRDRGGARAHGAWDAIFCRHALAPLGDAARRTVLGVLQDQLAPEGVLLVGQSQIIEPGQADLIARPERGLSGYRRP